MQIKTLTELVERYPDTDIATVLNHVDNYLTTDQLEELVQQFIIDYMEN